MRSLGFQPVTTLKKGHVATWSSLSEGVGGIACKADRSLIHTTQTLRNSLDDNTSSYFFKRQHRQQWQREERAQLRMSQSDIQHRQLRLLLQQKSCLCCYCCYYISVVFQNPQAKNSSKNLKWQPAFRLVKVVFVVVNRQHKVVTWNAAWNCLPQQYFLPVVLNESTFCLCLATS